MIKESSFTSGKGRLKQLNILFAEFLLASTCAPIRDSCYLRTHKERYTLTEWSVQEGRTSLVSGDYPLEIILICFKVEPTFVVLGKGLMNGRRPLVCALCRQANYSEFFVKL
ncbi:hypothetical protein NPIL_297121 [Nephila pilipes]|uniref:Uncharacterized protein n=1 Tax=Nephila pilipes TaxID=299642 RepID=A0A8X6UG38_NEPPI|nr:hypothetical protein NPIL_297121 [Nephila pilipes]